MLLKERFAKALAESEFSENQSELARACGVRPSAINMILSGETKNISTALLFKAARAMLVNAEWLGVGSGPERGSELPAPAPLHDPILDALRDLGPKQEQVWRKRIELALAEAQAAEDQRPRERPLPLPKSTTAR
jgi:transcriptional regulator with XRE-family HTH domain